MPEEPTTTPDPIAPPPEPAPARPTPRRHDKTQMLTEQVDQLGQYAIRDLPRELGEGLERHFPHTAAALPRERWRQVGWTLAGLAGVYWLVGLGPELAQPLVWLAGLGVGGYTGWHVLRHWRQARRDETALRFRQHAGELQSPDEPTRIAALAALDQLAYDNPRYRLALMSLLAAWLQQRRDAGVPAGHDAAVAVQMIAEFRALLLDSPEDSEEQPVMDGAAETLTIEPEPPPFEIVSAEPVDTAAPRARAAQQE